MKHKYYIFLILIIVFSCNNNERRLDSNTSILNIDGNESFVVSNSEYFENPQANKINNKGLKFAKNGEYEDALKQFYLALKIEPNNWLTLSNIGLAYMESNKYEKAASFFKKSILNSDSIEAMPFLNLSVLQMRNSKFDDSIQNANIAYRIAKTKTTKFSAVYNLITCYVFTNQCIKANTSIHKLRELNKTKNGDIADISEIEQLIYKCK